MSTGVRQCVRTCVSYELEPRQQDQKASVKSVVSSSGIGTRQQDRKASVTLVVLITSDVIGVTSSSYQLMPLCFPFVWV